MVVAVGGGCVDSVVSLKVVRCLKSLETAGLEERLCPSGLVYTEKLVIESFPVSLLVRRSFSVIPFNNLMMASTDYDTVLLYIND